MATAYYHFQKKSAVQHLIHNLKYKGHQEAGTAVGNWLGSTLAHTADYKPIDAIIPVPLHPAKLQKRGYNQATAFAQGLSEGMHVPYFDNVLQRNTFTQSQTRKNRIERWDNVADVFAVNQKPLGNARHLLLVDDVITTGATFEACIHTLIQNIPNAQVYVAAMAVGGKS
jgi:ComF family protein